MWEPDVSAAWLGRSIDPMALSGVPEAYASITEAHDCHQTNGPITQLRFSSSGIGFVFDEDRRLGAEPRFSVETGCGEAFLRGCGSL